MRSGKATITPSAANSWEPELEEGKEIEKVLVSAADAGRGHLNVKCEVRLVVTASLGDREGTVVTSARRGRGVFWSIRRPA